MPQALKDKLRRLQELNTQSQQLDFEITEAFNSYGIHTDVFCISPPDVVGTEALAFITNAEGDIEDNIRDIEEVFLHYVNDKWRRHLNMLEEREKATYRQDNHLQCPYCRENKTPRDLNKRDAVLDAYQVPEDHAFMSERAGEGDPGHNWTEDRKCGTCGNLYSLRNGC